MSDRTIDRFARSNPSAEPSLKSLKWQGLETKSKRALTGTAIATLTDKQTTDALGHVVADSEFCRR